MDEDVYIEIPGFHGDGLPLIRKHYTGAEVITHDGYEPASYEIVGLVEWLVKNRLDVVVQAIARIGFENAVSLFPIVDTPGDDEVLENPVASQVPTPG